ncbi:hypothetical protein [uncultured Sulfitobacter sp.]|uniref:hypothetical protein n=1 Tax=uncultured Sulfitobacter sp. TaxID=191468 RepID=UPI00259A899D|nr:hypothetical protein [uncultured Sulfitobacter sp.]
MAAEGDNKPPYVVLELDEDEAKWVYEKLAGQDIDTEQAFLEWCAMSGADPRANMRSSMTMRLAVERENFDTVLDKFERQQPALTKIKDRLREFFDKHLVR